MNSKTTICTLALAYLGQAPISSLQQNNEPARWLQLFYEPVRDEVLRTHNWAFATAEKPLVCVQTPVATGGDYLYQYPADALFIRRVYVAGAENLAFTERFDPTLTQRVLCAAQPHAVACYTRRITDETQFDPAFVKCFALALAGDCALALTGDIELAAQLQQKYTLYLEEARRANMSERVTFVPQKDAFSEVR